MARRGSGVRGIFDEEFSLKFLNEEVEWSGGSVTGHGVTAA